MINIRFFISRTQAGFSLLELLIVVAILAAVAGTSALVLNDLNTDTQSSMARVEIQSVATAIRQFRQDTGYYPKQGPFSHFDDDGQVGTTANSTERTRLKSPANLEQLFVEPVNNANVPIMEWNVDTGRGWRGPYLHRSGEGVVDIGDNLAVDGGGEPTKGNALNNLLGVADSFAYNDPVVRNSSYASCTKLQQDTANCVLEWRAFSDTPSPPYDSDKHYVGSHGRPYLLFFAPDNSPSIVSMGPDGRYGGCDDHPSPNGDGDCDNDDIDPCQPRGDDMVICFGD